MRRTGHFSEPSADSGLVDLKALIQFGRQALPVRHCACRYFSSVASHGGCRSDGNTMPKDGVHPIDKHVGSRVRMRRLMLGMSQSHLGDALGLTFQQVQKYEKGTNRISASRLQHISDIFQVPVEFFFEGAPHVRGQDHAQTDAPSPQYVADFLATSDGLHLTKAFMHIQNARLRRSIVTLVEQIASPEKK